MNDPAGELRQWVSDMGLDEDLGVEEKEAVNYVNAAIRCIDKGNKRNDDMAKFKQNEAEQQAVNRSKLIDSGVLVAPEDEGPPDAA